MTESLASRLIEARRAQGLTQQQIANALGVSRAAVGQWESGITEPSVRNMKALNDLLSFKVRMEGGGSNEIAPMIWRSLTSQAADAERHIDVPITMIIAASSASCFEISSKQGLTFDNVYRPPYIADRSGVYGAIILSNALYPRFESEDVIYVDPNERPIEKEYTVVSLSATIDGKSGVFLRRIKSLSSTEIYLETFQPHSEASFPLSCVTYMHRVLPWNELLSLRSHPWTPEVGKKK